MGYLLAINCTNQSISCILLVGLATASGLAALTTLIHLLNAGDHVVVCDDVYGGKVINIRLS